MNCSCICLWNSYGVNRNALGYLDILLNMQLSIKVPDSMGGINGLQFPSTC